MACKDCNIDRINKLLKRECPFRDNCKDRDEIPDFIKNFLNPKKRP